MMLSNYKEHPVKTNYLIFSYTNINMANTFEELLQQQNIPFEKDEEGYGENNVFMLAVKTQYRKEAIKNNFIAYGKHRKPLISNKVVKYVLLLFFFGLITLALLGYIYNKK